MENLGKPIAKIKIEYENCLLILTKVRKIKLVIC